MFNSNFIKRTLCILLCSFMAVILLVLPSCIGRPYDDFREAEEMSEVYIVWIGYVGSESIITNYEILYQANNVDEFITEFRTIEYTMLADTVGKPYPFEYALLIKYFDGSEELISCRGLQSVNNSKVENYMIGCNEEQFLNFIGRYIDIEMGKPKQKS